MARKAWRAPSDAIRRGRQDATSSHRTDRASRNAMVGVMPQLGGFAVSLSNAQQAGELVQETLLLPREDWQAARRALVKQLTRLRDQFGTEPTRALSR